MSFFSRFFRFLRSSFVGILATVADFAVLVEGDGRLLLGHATEEMPADHPARADVELAHHRRGVLHRNIRVDELHVLRHEVCDFHEFS